MIKQEVINLIRNDATYHEILSELDLYDYELLHLYYQWLFLRRKKLPEDIAERMRQDYLQYFSFINLKRDKIMLIADSHLGSKYENLLYLEQAKEIAKKRKINTIFHGGDIGDGLVEHNPIHKNYQEQIEYILAKYSFFEDMDQYIMGGNHDRRYKESGLDILKLISELYENVTPIGYYQSYFKVFEKIISFEHNSKIRKKNKLINPDFIIAAHSHKGVFKNGEVKLPTASDINPNCEPINSEPGFEILITSKDKTGVNLNFERYETTENGPEKTKVKTYHLSNNKKRHRQIS